MEIQIRPGEDINDAARHMCGLATNTKECIVADFNGIKLAAKPDDKPEDIVAEYYKKSEERHTTWIVSDEYKERERGYREKQERQRKELEEALARSPEKISLRDEALWNKSAKVNSDGYGSAVVRYAERWGRIMEGEIARGAKLEDCMEKAERLADTEGITGFMYGCAVSLLSATWIYGESFRLEYNRKNQIGDEGEKANMSGGTLNPATITIG